MEKKFNTFILKVGAMLVLLPVLVACASIEVSLGRAYGDIRVEPHPNYADSVRIATRIPMLGPDALHRTAGPDTLVVAVLGERCRGAHAFEEGRTVGDVGVLPRIDITYRVICPAARG